MSVANLKRRLHERLRGRRTVVGVIGSGKTADPGCGEVGRLIAGMGFDLLTGGGRGVMEAVSRAFFETVPRRGIVVGVVPASVEPLEALEERQPGTVQYEPPPGYPNEWVELVIYTHLPDSGPDGTLRSSRNHINVLSADAIVAMPGQEGTESEIWLAAQYGVPVVAFGDHHETMARGVPRARTLAELRQFLEQSVR